MPSCQVGFHPEAVAEAIAAAQWYRERSSAAADAFLSELEFAVDRITGNPKRWPQYVHGTQRFLLRRFPFCIVYREMSGIIEVF